MRYYLVALILAGTAHADELPRPKYAATTLRLSREHEFIPPRSRTGFLGADALLCGPAR